MAVLSLLLLFLIINHYLFVSSYAISRRGLINCLSLFSRKALLSSFFFSLLENDFQITLYFNCKWVPTYWTFKEFINLSVHQSGLTWIYALKRALLQDFRVRQDSCCTDIWQWAAFLADIFCSPITFFFCSNIDLAALHNSSTPHRELADN